MFEDVADTARWVATYRAMESARPDALFHDPLADRLAGDRGRDLARRVVGTRNFAWMLAMRTYIIDDLIARAVAGGVETVLNLGAGMDSRPYRLELPKSLRWIEADQPSLVALKNELLANETPRCQFERRALDLANDDERRSLFASIDGDTLVLCEGVIGYLTNDDVTKLAQDLRARPNFRRSITDRSSPMLARSMKRRRRVQQDFRRAPIRFAPDDWPRFFGSAGWSIESIRYLVEEGDRLHRPVPLPVWMRVARHVLPRRFREDIQRMLAIVVLAATESASAGTGEHPRAT